MKFLAVPSFFVAFPALLVLTFILLMRAWCQRSEPAMIRSFDRFNNYSLWLIGVMDTSVNQVTIPVREVSTSKPLLTFVVQWCTMRVRTKAL